MKQRSGVLVIACGAISKEISLLLKLNRWEDIQVKYLSAEFHNYPDKITRRVEDLIKENQQKFRQIFVAYGDCGTGGMLDQLISQYGIKRLPGAHCYEFFSGSTLFLELSTKEPGSFYLTDFLARNFQRLVIQGLGIDRNPELQVVYFANYKKMIYFTQTKDSSLMEAAKSAAQCLNLPLESYYTGYGELEKQLTHIAT